MGDRNDSPRPFDGPSASKYRDTYDRSVEDSDSFWLTVADNTDWVEPPQMAGRTNHEGLTEWFADGTLNTAFNALDRHVEAGRGEDPALVYVSAMTGARRTYSYAELRDETAKAAGALASMGVRQGDRVLIYMPMIAEAVMAMLACARLGAVHAVVFGGFGAAELAARIDDAQPTVIVTASCGLEPGRVVPYIPLLDAALSLSTHTPGHVVIVHRPEETLRPTEERSVRWLEHAWSDVMADAQPAPCQIVRATDPLYILYTSGTTGLPKGIVRDNGGHAVALQWSLRYVYGIEPGDVIFAASDIGWVVGHSYIVYAPLLLGATTILYEGKPVGTPDAGALWEIVEQYRVNVLLSAPTAIRAIRREDPRGDALGFRDLGSLRALFLAGERLDPDTQRWLSEVQSAPVINNWWQTETGWPVASNFLGIEYFNPKPGSSTKPVPGFRIAILDDEGIAVGPGREGAVCLQLPLPPGSFSRIWGDEARARRSYLDDHPGYYTSGDGGLIDEDGYIFILGRTDDVMNVAGHRLSSGQIEAVITEHPGVSECAVVGVADPIKGHVPHAIVVPEIDHLDKSETLIQEVSASVRQQVGPIARLSGVEIVTALPKTRSGKIVRRCLRQILDGDEPDVPPTIENPNVIGDLVRTLTTRQRSSRKK